MVDSAQARAARKRYKAMAPVLDEQSRRRFVALEAQALGRGGVSLMARITGLSRRTIYHGLSDIQSLEAPLPGRVRKHGGGRKRKVFKIRPLAPILRKLGKPRTRATRCSPSCGHVAVCVTL